jgi:hypothetical protein
MSAGRRGWAGGFSAVALIVALAGGGSAAADPLFDEFHDLCIGADSEPAAAIRQADAAGWQPMPEGLRSQVESLGLTVGEGRIRLKDRVTTLLVVGEAAGEVAGEALAGQVCAMAQRPGRSTTLQQAAADWAAVPPAEIEAEGATAYAFTDQAGVRTPIDVNDKDRAREQLASGDARALLAGRRSGFDALFYVIPKS